MEEAEHEGGGHRPFIIKFDGKTLQSGSSFTRQEFTNVLLEEVNSLLAAALSLIFALGTNDLVQTIINRYVPENARKTAIIFKLLYVLILFVLIILYTIFFTWISKLTIVPI